MDPVELQKEQSRFNILKDLLIDSQPTQEQKDEIADFIDAQLLDRLAGEFYAYVKQTLNDDEKFNSVIAEIIEMSGTANDDNEVEVTRTMAEKFASLGVDMSKMDQKETIYNTYVKVNSILETTYFEAYPDGRETLEKLYKAANTMIDTLNK